MRFIRNIKNKARRPVIITMTIVACALFVFTPIKPGHSFAPCGYECTSDVIPAHDETHSDATFPQHEETIEHFMAEFQDQELWLLTEVFREWLVPIWQNMNEQIVTTMMHQTFIIGTFFDAKIQLETQLLIQELNLEAHKDYRASKGMCVFGTNIKSLAEAERNAEFTTFVLSQRSMDRQMGQVGSSGAHGQYADRNSRTRQFKNLFCNLEDLAGGTGGENMGSLYLLCNDDPKNTASAQSGPDNFVNNDIDFSRTIDYNNTLDIDLTDDTVTEDELSIFALANNLYSHDLMFRMPELAAEQEVERARLLDFRHIVAKRSVAEHSFNTIVGLKTMGKEIEDGSTEEENTVEYMRNIMESLGIEDEPLQTYLISGGPVVGGEPTERPSYYAQMEVLTKRIYQQPEFYTDLYESPANVDRKRVAMEAIGLMQNFDTWQSHLRTEAMLSVLLDLEVMVLQEDVQNKINLLN